MNSSVLRCENLSKTYVESASKVDVLKNISLAVQPAELVVIMGSSGSGKSTLLHLLGGLDVPTTGTVYVADKNLNTLSEKEKSDLRNRYMGFVYQFHHLLPEFTALENVGMPLLIRGFEPKRIKEKAAHFLDLVGLKERLQHKIGELSGGERQRVAIARALIVDPLCILADEPTGNLDEKNANTVLELFLTLQKSFKTSVVLVTHDSSIAGRAERMFVLENGGLSAQK